MAYKVILVLGTLVAFSAAGIIRPGSCPNMTVVTNFELDQYLGVWYEQERYEQEFQFSFDCVTATYGIPNPDVVEVSVNNRGVLLGETPQVFNAEGVAVPTFPDDLSIAKFNVSFFGLDPDRSNYWVVGTDYTSYSLVWACEDLGDNTYSESAWVLSRDNQVSDEFWDTIDLLLWINNISRDDFRKTEQRQEICLPDITPA